MNRAGRKLILFDFDGVIVDSLDVYEDVVRRCLAKIGRPLVQTRQDFLALYEDNFYEGVARLGIELSAFLDALAEIRPHVDLSRIKPYEPMALVLRKLAQRHRLMLISSNTGQTIQPLLVRMEVQDCFEAVLGADAFLNKTEKILHAQGQSGIAKERVYYVGDTTGDIREARRAGVKAVAVTWGWHGREILEAAGPDYLIESASALLDLLLGDPPGTGC